MGLFEQFIFMMEFDFSHNKACIFTMEFIDFEGVRATFHQPTGLVDNARLAELHHLKAIVEGYLAFEFVTRESTIQTGPLNSKVRAFISYTYTYRTTTLTADITLLNVALRKSLVLERVVKHEEFAFNLLCHL
jgi:hypothetical protein